MEYTIRHGAYAVIFDEAGRVGAIAGASGTFFLPGGGIEPNENPDEALSRELLEECEATVELIEPVGKATDLLFSGAEQTYFEKQGRFWRARFLTPPNGELIWVPIEDVSKLFRQEGHVWAVKMALQHSVCNG